MSLTAVLATPTAQVSPPRPAVDITRVTLGATVWPADFNGDGRADLVGSEIGPFGQTGPLAVTLGTGSGNFGPVTAISSTRMTALVVGDFNGDGRTDILGRDDNGAPEINGDSYFFAGNGNGTFASPVLVLEDVGGAHAQAADFNADGKVDVAIVREGDSLEVHPGDGNGTFGPPSTMVTGLFPDGMVAADLNNDALPDIVVATRYGWTVEVFINQGGLLFTTTSFSMPTPVAGITAWDLNNDGNRDIVAGSLSEEGIGSDAGQDGVVYVFGGNGDGTFDPFVTFPTGNDPKFVVGGDFNRDGIADIATGNWSDWYDGRCDGFNFMPHSVSILPGRGDGTLAPAATFTLGPYPDFDSVSRVHSLKTTDLNGDGRTDLIASGSLLFNAAARANRAPVANAGPDREGVPAPLVLHGSATDADHHWLRFRWTNESGIVINDEATMCDGEIYEGPETYTLRVEDSEGGVDTDTVTVANDGPNGPDGSIDIGNGGATGSTELNDSGQWVLTGAGADIWGTADEFHYQAHLERGDFDATVRVASIQNVHQWTKAGLMIRESFDSGSRHAFVFATPTTVKGIAFQRRPTTNGISAHTAGPAAAPPAWLMLSRRGDVIRAYYAATGGAPWTLVGEQVLTGLPRDVLIGMAVTSHVDGVAATATFENYTITPPELISVDIGTVGRTGTTVIGESTITIEGGGADIWGTADAFRYAYRRVNGDAFVQVDVDSIEATHAWSKAGLMFRESLSPGSKHVMAIVSAGKGVAMQYRPTTGGASLQQAQIPGTAPRRLVMQRKGDQFNAWVYPVDSGGAGVFLGSVVVPMGQEIWVGIPVTAHNNATLATGVFRNFSVGLF